MTERLYDRLREGLPPFDEWTIRSETMDVPRLRQAVASVAALLDETPLVELKCFQDWTFHDGTPSRAKPLTWARVHAMIASDEEAEALSPAPQP